MVTKVTAVSLSEKMTYYAMVAITFRYVMVTLGATWQVHPQQLRAGSEKVHMNNEQKVYKE